MKKTFRIVKDGTTPGCPIYRVDQLHRIFLFITYWLEDESIEHFYSVDDALYYINDKFPGSNVYIKFDNDEIDKKDEDPIELVKIKYGLPESGRNHVFEADHYLNDDELNAITELGWEIKHINPHVKLVPDDNNIEAMFNNKTFWVYNICRKSE